MYEGKLFFWTKKPKTLENNENIFFFVLHSFQNVSQLFVLENQNGSVFWGEGGMQIVN